MQYFSGMTGWVVVTGKLDVREAAAKLPNETMQDLSDNDSVEALEEEALV
jgi:hypothetical protein